MSLIGGFTIKREIFKVQNLYTMALQFQISTQGQQSHDLLSSILYYDQFELTNEICQ